jgi:hypothetical protein
LIVQHADSWSPAPIAAISLFAVVNLALIRIKRQEPAPPGARIYLSWVPCGGLILVLGLLSAHFSITLPV